MNCIILSGIHAALAMEILLWFDNILFYLHCCLHLCTRLLILSPEDITRKTGLASSHCLASCDIMISLLGDGDKDGNAAGSGFLLDSEFNVKGRWEKPGHSPLFGYDFWYQPQHKTDKHIMGCSCYFHQKFLTCSMSLMAFMGDIYMLTCIQLT
ncbi:unnamed protein product [Trifolium pratense]|uniref:Uncharacterized protein n=1 Tax=Trifolium pratense TaxID=57577 RepID=A0ACB0LSD6_TRIPR|nr:unnamed protein product [Trifolium pratense]